MHERALRRPHELRPAIVDMLAECRGGVRHLSVYDEVDEVFGLVFRNRAADEPNFPRSVLAALAEITLIEGEAQVAVFEHEVFARAVVPASVHAASASYLGFLPHRSG